MVEIHKAGRRDGSVVAAAVAAVVSVVAAVAAVVLVAVVVVADSEGRGDADRADGVHGAVARATSAAMQLRS